MSTPQFLFLQSIQLLITIFPQRPLPIPDISNVLYLRGNFLPWHKSQILALFRDNYVLTSPKSRALLQKNTSHLSFPQYPFSFFQTRPQIPCVSKLPANPTQPPTHCLHLRSLLAPAASFSPTLIWPSCIIVILCSSHQQNIHWVLIKTQTTLCFTLPFCISPDCLPFWHGSKDLTFSKIHFSVCLLSKDNKYINEKENRKKS